MGNRKGLQSLLFRSLLLFTFVLSMGSELRAEVKPGLAILPFLIERGEDPGKGVVCPICKGSIGKGEVVPGLSKYPDAGIIREDGGLGDLSGSPFRKNGGSPFQLG